MEPDDRPCAEVIDEGRKRVQSQVAAAAESGEEVKCCRQRNVEIVVFCGFSPDSILNFEGNKDMMNYDRSFRAICDSSKFADFFGISAEIVEGWDDIF